MKTNIILDTDSYKASHFLQYPPGTTKVFSYIESRGGEYDETLFFGLQYYLKEYLSQPITTEDVEEAKLFFEAHGEPFNYEGWMYIAQELKGKLPLRIRAVPEGSVIPTHNILVSIENTDPKAPWLTSWVETVLVRLWYPITVATRSFHIKKTIYAALEKSSDDPNAEIPFKFHDFGARGVSSRESAMIGGAAHLVSFLGSDTVAGVLCANRYYHCPMAGFSIPAAEHSTITSYGKEREVEAYRNMLRHFAKPGAIVAVVSDSYDFWNAIENLWGGELRDEVIKSGATIVIRPDSGHPPSVVLRAAQVLDQKFGSTINSKGYKVLNHVRLIQGDGINEDSVQEILDTLLEGGFSASNLAMGCGGGLLQQLNRDTNRFAQKASNIEVNGVSVDICKDPITDPIKKSKSGRLDLVMADGKYQTVKLVEGQETHPNSVMRTVFENGMVLIDDSLEIVRSRAVLK